MNLIMRVFGHYEPLKKPQPHYDSFTNNEVHNEAPSFSVWGHLAVLVVMAHAFAELRNGVVARQHEERFGHNFAQTLYYLR